MKSSGSAVSWVVVIMAASSLLSMIGMLRIDRMIHNDLYRFGLQFSYAWAVPYWNIVGFVFAMGWFNIIAAISIHLYSLAFKRKEIEQLVTEVEKEISKTETTPQPEKAEEPMDQEPKPADIAETVEEQPQPKETPVSVTESETQEKKETEETTVTEETLEQEKTEERQPEEVVEQKEQEPEPLAEPEAEQEAQGETRQETPEKSEETPILPGVSQEELPPPIEETQQQATTGVA